MYFWYFHSVTLKLPSCLLPNWGEKSLTCQIPVGEGGSACLHLPVSTAEPEHHIVQDCFSLKVHSALVGLIRCEWKHRWVKYPMSQAISGKANSYSLLYSPPSSLTIPRGSRISQQTGHLLGEDRIRAYKDQFPILKIPWWSLGNNFPRDSMDTPKWPSQISFLNPSTLVNLCTKQQPPAYSRLLWGPAPSSPSQGGDQAPSSILLGGFLLTWVLSSPAAVHYFLMWKVLALKSRILPEGRGAFPPPGDSSYKASGWPQMRPVSSKWGVSRPMHQML